MDMDTSTAGVTVTDVEPETSPDVAVMVAVPTPPPVASPVELTTAMVVSDVVHVTEVLKSCVLLSENRPVAISCCVVPFAIFGLVGATEMEVTTFTDPPERLFLA